MRNLDRDRRPVWIARFKANAAQKDEQGRLTGSHEPIYSPPELFWPTVTVGRGAALVEHFGMTADYDRVVRIDDPDFDVSEQDVLWIDSFYEDTKMTQHMAVRDPTSYQTGHDLDGGSFDDWDSGDDADDGEMSDVPTAPPDYVVTRVGHGRSYTIFTAKRRRSEA